MTHHLVGLTEIAEMLEVTPQRVAQIVKAYGDFPAPDAELASGRVWKRRDVDRWIKAHPSRPRGRPPRPAKA
jgi:prophage regulatory protein